MKPTPSNSLQAPDYSRVKNDGVSAAAYSRRKPRKHDAEMQMVADIFALIPANDIETVLDAPCGVGRLSLWLCQQGLSVTAVDLGEAAVNFTRSLLTDSGFTSNVKIQDIFAMSFADCQFDATVCFRLLHHFASSEARQQLIAELCRVSRRYVVISYISPTSVTSLKRRFRYMINGKPIKQYPTPLAELERAFRPSGFEFLGRVKRSTILHSLQLVVFKRSA